MMAQQIETLLFDFGGTLDADGVAWKERFHAHYRAEGLDMTAETFAAAFYASDSPLVGDLPLDADLSKTVHRLTANLEAELARCDGDAAKHRAEGDRSERVAARFLAEAYAAFARTRPLLEALRGRYRLGVVSNFYGNLEAVCHSAGLAPLFGVIVDSHRIGAEKPDPAIFRAALEPLCAKAETTLFVGDSLRRDREGARGIGMGFLWIAPREVQAFEVLAAKEPLDHSAIARLDDLAEILDDR
jgi:HAD superfamily hydrolase (TIGR01549 family)